MRHITEHHDGHGLNESITLTCDDQDPNGGGASHLYQAAMVVADPSEEGAPPQSSLVLHVQFQHGPRAEPGSKHGITEAVLYSILLDRLRAFQAGPYPCMENEHQIEMLEKCLASTKRRADERAARGVLGKNQK